MLTSKTGAMIQMQEGKEVMTGLDKLSEGIERGMLRGHVRGIPRKVEGLI